MSTAKTKQKIRRRLKGLLKGSKTGQGATRSRVTSRSRSTTDSALSSLGISTTTSGGALTRSLGTRNLTPDRSEARRARADARADISPYSPPQVSKPPALKRQNAKRDLNRSDRAGKKDPDNTLPDLTSLKRPSVYDVGKGRTLFATETADGKRRARYEALCTLQCVART